MKKLFYLTIFVSGLFFGQNLSALKNNNPKELSKLLFQNYKQIDSVKAKDNTLHLVFMPIDATKSEMEDYQNGNKCNRCASAKFMKSETGFYFLEATADFTTLFQFWKTNVEPNATEKQEPHPVYFYKNTEQKTWFNFWKTDGGHWIVKNMSNRF